MAKPELWITNASGGGGQHVMPKVAAGSSPNARRSDGTTFELYLDELRANARVSFYSLAPSDVEAMEAKNTAAGNKPIYAVLPQLSEGIDKRDNRFFNIAQECSQRTVSASDSGFETPGYAEVGPAALVCLPDAVAPSKEEPIYATIAPRSKGASPQQNIAHTTELLDLDEPPEVPPKTPGAYIDVIKPDVPERTVSRPPAN